MKHARLLLLMVATLLCSFAVKAQITDVSQLSNDEVYFVSLPYHSKGTTSWVIAEGGTALQSNVQLGIKSDLSDTRQQFSFITNNGSTYLYHPAEGKYVNQDGSLSATPQHKIYFKAGKFDATFVIYFSSSKYINVNGERNVVIDSWSTADGGNSCSIMCVNPDAEYIVTFYDWDGTVLKTETVKCGQSATAPANPEREGYTFTGWDKDFSSVYIDLNIYPTYGSLDDVLPSLLPRAEYWYDFEGVGEKGFVNNTKIDWLSLSYSPINPYYTAGISQRFVTLKNYYGSGGEFYYVEDLNGDGVMDFSAGYSGSYISQGDSHVFEGGALIITNFDVNNDGRIDYLKSKGSNSWSIMVQQADGAFVEQFMQVVTETEYEASFDPDDWYSTYTNSKPRPSPVRFSGVSLASAPSRREANAPQMRAQGMNPTVAAPTRALDLNADGYVDLINEKEGILYYNGGDGRWIHTVLGGSVMVADLNGDHIQDFIFPGQELWVAVYRGEGDFEEQTLYQNIQVDREMYCYDFDRDGDVDILVTFSAPLNSTGYAYTMFFDNDGTGQFTQLDEQDYGNNNLLFSNCQDLDGDGYYDLLAFRGDLDGNDVDVVWLKGLPNKTFAQPEVLIDIPFDEEYDNTRSITEEKKISAEDLNNDGQMEVWVNFMLRAGGNVSKFKSIPTYSFESATNTAPTAPAKPELRYSNGMLTISWGDGSDKQTATSDLTYALRVGTTPGGDDIVRAHANADGTRRNFLDGNMSKFHNYTLDLTQHQPSTIYVSVQTIDAQHLGSAWSEEASVEHTGFFADFRVSIAELGLGLPMTATAPVMPNGFTHTWVAEDGVCTGNGHEVEIIFNTAGEKTITHTLTAADGTSMSHVVMVNVMPNYTNLNEGVEMEYRYPLNGPMADYNMDGYWDVVSMGDYVNETRVHAICKGGEDFSFALAAGVWNTGLTFDRGFWYDWDHNGAVDFLFTDEYINGNFYYIPHNGTSNMRSKQEDDNLKGLLADENSYYIDGIYYRNYQTYVDFTHDGNYEYFVVGRDDDVILSVYTRQTDGNYQAQSIRGDADEELLSSMITSDKNLYVDINSDGFVDICNLIADGRYTPYNKLTVLVNKGNCEFEKLIIPFDTELSQTNDDVHYRLRHLVDMNNDGYLDFLSVRADGAPYILWNEENKRFTAPYVLPVGELDRYTSGYNSMYLADLDNNGYLDVVTFQQNESMGSEGLGYYVHYFGQGGVIQQGFVMKEKAWTNSDNFIKFPNHPWTFYYYDKSGQLVTIHGASNKRPSAPSDVRAVQTAKGLLIEWNHAKDDATPGVQMRYNLSVKKKGASGEGAYIISPQNACNPNAAPIRNFNYITAKQYLVPNTVLPIGEYEIQLQAIDLQGDWSVFTEPLTIAVEEMSMIDAPASACTDGVVEFAYVGTPTAETPVWNFDGAVKESGSGFGPYTLSWSTPGTKTVTLTLGEKVITRMIYVSESGAGMIFPEWVFENSTTKLNIPEDMKMEWWMRPYRSNKSEEEEWKALDYYSKMVELVGDKLIWKEKVGADYQWEFKTKLTNDNDCAVEVVTKKNIRKQSGLPRISKVTANDKGQNVIYVTNRSSISMKVRVLKETNRRDQYVEIGVCEDGSLTDVSSNASAQSERYVLQAILSDGTVAPFYSPAHQTSHLTINRGLTDNTWNLIWSDYEYEGADIVSYNILRGTSPDNLVEIASISSRHNSYTDYTPDANAPYYAIEYVLGNVASYAPGMSRAVARTSSNTGRSNVVNSNMANTMVYANSVSVLSATKKYQMNEDSPALALYAEILPAAATSRNVRWEIIGGNDLATITSSGVLTANNPNRGGVVTVQATTIDGTNLTATRQITVVAMGEVTPEPETTYTVTFYDWNNAVLKTQTVKQGESATAPTAPTRTGYTFTGWDKAFANVQSNLSVYAVYTQNGVTEYNVTFYDWNGTVLKTQMVQQGQSATAPANPTREGYTFMGWDKVFTNIQADLVVNAVYTQNSVTPNPGESEGIASISQLDNETLYHVLLPYHGKGATSWAVAQGATAMQSNADIHAAVNREDTRQQFAFITNNGGTTYYLYHPAEKKYVNKDGSLSTTARDAVAFKAGAYANTFVVYFDNSHFVNVNGEQLLLMNNWGPGGSWGYADGGNSCVIIPVGKFSMSEPEPEPGTDELSYTTQFNAGANGWIEGTTWYDEAKKIAVYTSPLYRAQGGKVTKLRITVNSTKGNTKYFGLSELEFYDGGGRKIALTASDVISNADHNALNPSAPDGGGFAALFDGQTSTYFHSAWKNMPAEDHYLEVTLPNGGYDAFSFKMLSRAHVIENGMVYDQSHIFPSVMVMTTMVALVADNTSDSEPEPEPMPELDNDVVYYVSQPYNGGTSWAIATGGSEMSINTKLGITADGADARQQFAFITNDGGKTRYLYHPAEKKYVNKDNTLSTTPRDPVYFEEGMYDNTFVVYFDSEHVINTNSVDGLIINRWGPFSGWGKADDGNSCRFTAMGKFDISDSAIDAVVADEAQCVRKVIEYGKLYITLPDGSKYTMTGVRVK